MAPVETFVTAGVRKPSHTHKRSFMPRSSGTRERFSATVIFQAATADLSVGVASFAVPAIDADRYPSPMRFGVLKKGLAAGALLGLPVLV